MDVSKTDDGQKLLKISQSSETGEHIIEYATPQIDQIIKLQSGGLGEEVAIDPAALLEAIKLDQSVCLSTADNENTKVIEIKGEHQMLSIGENQHIIIMPKQLEGNSQHNICEGLEVQTIQRFNSYPEFKRALNEYESKTVTKFILRNQSKQFTAPVCLHDILRNEKNASDLPMIRWEFCAAKDFLPIPFMGIPYITIGKQVFQCHQGKDYNTNKKQQYELRKEILNQATRFQIKSRNKGPSKKLDCPVLFAVRKMYFFPEFPVEKDTKRNRALAAQKLRNKLTQIKKEKCTCVCKEDENNSTCEVIGKLEYLTQFPPSDLHNHDDAKAANFMKIQLKKHGTKGIQVMQTKKQTERNPYQYDKHVELINTLRAAGDLEQLRTAREDMSVVYPLSEELWLEWFHDEIPLAVIPEQKEYIISKFEEAIKDYHSVKVWHEYCQYMMNNIDSPADIDHARNVFEQAITAVGLHVTEGSSIWDGYREFEMAILDSYQQLQDSGDTVGMDAKVKAQIERISTIFQRQLSIPLIGLAETMKTFEDWSPEPLQNELIHVYEKASQKLIQCLEFEEKLNLSPENSLADYLTYIQYEIKDGDPARVQCLYERSIKDHCLQHELWEKYSNYLDFKLKISNIAISVHERAVRNCPWVSKLWQNYLYALERANEPYSKYKDVFNQSLKGGFAGADGYLQLWLTNCDYHRRRISNWNFEESKIDELHKTYEEAITYMNHYFGLEGDKYCLLLREWALVEAKYLQNIKRSQELWDTVMKKHSRDPSMWIEYVHFLMLYSDILAVRHVFQRAVQINHDSPHIICDAFLKFERQYGTLPDIDDAQQKICIQMQRFQERKEKESLKDASFNQSLSEKRKEHKSKNKSMKSTKKKKLEKGKNKRKAETDHDDATSGKKSRGENTYHTEAKGSMSAPSLPNTLGENQPEYFEIENKNIGVAMTEITPPSSSEPRAETTADETAVSSAATVNVSDTTNNPQWENKVDNDYSVFLSNLLFRVTEDDLKDMFQKCGDIADVHIVLNKMGKSKGYAYLQFKNKESVNEALKMDRETLLDRPVFVSTCVDKKEQPTQFKYPAGIDKHTVYVSNLPFELSQEEVAQHFSQAGELTQVRLVTNRSGKSKGFAYIQYKNESDASTAILKLDKTILNNRPINVAVSNPPARKQKTESEKGKQHHSTTTQEAGSRGRAKTQLAFVPGVLLKSQKSSSDDTPRDQKSTNQSANLSNNDFRKFLSK